MKRNQGSVSFLWEKKRGHTYTTHGFQCYLFSGRGETWPNNGGHRRSLLFYHQIRLPFPFLPPARNLLTISSKSKTCLVFVRRSCFLGKTHHQIFGRPVIFLVCLLPEKSFPPPPLLRGNFSPSSFFRWWWRQGVQKSH